MTTFYDKDGNLTSEGIKWGTRFLMAARRHMQCIPSKVSLVEVEQLAREACGLVAGQLLTEKIKRSNVTRSR